MEPAAAPPLFECLIYPGVVQFAQLVRQQSYSCRVDEEHVPQCPTAGDTTGLLTYCCCLQTVGDLVHTNIVLVAIFTCVSYAEARNRYRLDVRLSVCLCVRPSDTSWHCVKTAEYIVMLSSPHDSPSILVLCISRSSRNSDGVTPCGGAKYRWGIKICAIFYQ